MTGDEQTAYIERAQQETRKFVAEQRAWTAKDARTVWMFPIGGMIVGGVLFGAGMIFMKLVGA